MKKYRASQARQRFSELLDAAEAAEEVIIERRGVLFSVRVLPKRERNRAQPHVASLDPILEAGEWTWEWAPGGLEVVARDRKTATTE